MELPTVEWRLPDWVAAELAASGSDVVSREGRMRLAVRLSRRNVEEHTGGPFGAVVFDISTHRVVAAGVNLVLPMGVSCAHAEIVALTLAQKVVGSYTLSANGGRYELVTSCEPCAMCLGAIPWSGVVRVLCGARDEDAREIGFEEGEKPTDWKGVLIRAGIDVATDVAREEARAVLRWYGASGAQIYNGATDHPRDPNAA